MKENNPMQSICGADCASCGYGKNSGCKGCANTDGCPFGKQCFIASYIKTGGMNNYNAFKQQLIAQFNALQIAGMPEITELYPLNGAFVNLSYPMPNGECVKLLDDNSIYLAAQVENVFSEGEAERCYGLVAGMDFILVSEFGINCDAPELLVFQKR